MEEDILFEAAIGDAIVKTETITFKQMDDEIRAQSLLYNPEMNEEMKIKWNNERLKYFDENEDLKKHEAHINKIEIWKEYGQYDQFYALYGEKINQCKCRPCSNIKIKSVDI